MWLPPNNRSVWDDYAYSSIRQIIHRPCIVDYWKLNAHVWYTHILCMYVPVLLVLRKIFLVVYWHRETLFAFTYITFRRIFGIWWFVWRDYWSFMIVCFSFCVETITNYELSLSKNNLHPQWARKLHASKLYKAMLYVYVDHDVRDHHLLYMVGNYSFDSIHSVARRVDLECQFDSRNVPIFLLLLEPNNMNFDWNSMNSSPKH